MLCNGDRRTAPQGDKFADALALGSESYFLVVVLFDVRAVGWGFGKWFVPRRQGVEKLLCFGGLCKDPPQLLLCSPKAAWFVGTGLHGGPRSHNGDVGRDNARRGRNSLRRDNLRRGRNSLLRDVRGDQIGAVHEAEGLS